MMIDGRHRGNWPGRFLALLCLLALLSVILPAFARGEQAAPDMQLPPIGQWTVGGKLNVTPMATGFRLTVPNDGDWGHVWVEVAADLDATPFVNLWITEVGRGAKWDLTANDPEVKQLESGAEDVGLVVDDLREKTGWHGRKRFRLYLTVVGKGNFIEVAGGSLSHEGHAPVDRPARWTRMNGALTPDSPETGAIPLTMPDSNADQWGGLITHLRLDVDRFPFVEATVTDLAPGARWRVALAGVASGPEHHNNGTVALNFRDFTAWRGLANVDVQVIFTRIGGGRAGTVSDVRFVPYPTASAALVGKAQSVASSSPFALLTTGGFRLVYDRTAGVFRLQRPDGGAALITRFLEMPGFDLTPPSTFAAQPTATGQRLEYTRDSGGAEFTVTAETTTAVPGLLHTRVTVHPTRDVHLASCGHEWAYAPSPSDSASPVLHRWATQNLSAAPIGYADAPDLGRVLYWQNLTALNPLLGSCGIAPRWLVSAGDRTFGFADPQDTGRRFTPGETYVLSDSYLYLTPHAPADDEPVAVANGLLKGMAAAYDALPDKPETEWRDWHGLAETSLHDLLDGDCWREFEGRLYLQAYVGVHGSVPQMAGTQELYAPLLGYHPAHPETVAARDTVLARLRTDAPTFWSPQRGTFREAASNGDHVWYNIPFHVTMARAALLGEKPTRDLCLKSADALMRLAADTHDTFLRADLGNSEPEMPGTYILFMMQCYALDPQPRFLAEARRVADSLSTGNLDGTHEIYWTAMTCEGLARLYAVTKDRVYLRTSLIPLARLMRNAWFWKCDYGLAHAWNTFGGLNADASGIDYIAAMEQEQSWVSLRAYLRLTDGALPPYAAQLVGELIRYIPMTIWDAYPAHLPAASLHQGAAFWQTDNRYDLAFPLEDLNDGWRKNGAVGQELYGSGACFALVNESYTDLPDAACTVYSELPLLSSAWDAGQNVLTLHLGGSARYRSKIEISGRTGSAVASAAPRSAPERRQLLPVTVAAENRLRLEAPGDSIVRVRFVAGVP